MSDSHGYRDDAREKRRAIIAFKVPWMRFLGPVIASLLAVAAAYGGMSVSENEVTFRCVRNEHGEGTCEHVIHYLATQKRETFDVRDVHAARVERTKTAPTYRTFVNVAGTEHALGAYNRNQDQLRFAAKLDQFANDPQARAFDDGYASGEFPLMTLLFVACVALGIVVVVRNRSFTAPRRLVLDEATNTATLERKPFVRWKAVWAIALDSVTGARFERYPNGSQAIMVDTTKHGTLSVDGGAVENDPAVAAITRFLSRDSA